MESSDEEMKRNERDRFRISAEVWGEDLEHQVKREETSPGFDTTAPSICMWDVVGVWDAAYMRQRKESRDDFIRALRGLGSIR
jgi:hypothetical protein